MKFFFYFAHRIAQNQVSYFFCKTAKNTRAEQRKNAVVAYYNYVFIIIFSIHTSLHFFLSTHLIFSYLASICNMHYGFHVFPCMSIIIT